MQMQGVVCNTPREGESAGAFCTIRGPHGEEAAQPEEARHADEGRNTRETGEPEESLYTIEGGNIRGTREAEEALPPGETRQEQ
ncbi:hypothetical protein Y1Q_0007496 [Alligator mississippiensis]|uniref:Uncharacterized protein n=1 Tax=Alligator mississippiensis TaxID=8496 RepID=A0A151M569_ALLMI|nr:hypothetical protein Y1Q_0007496 [Alligator mississippiensis]